MSRAYYASMNQTLCYACDRLAEYCLYPHFAAYNASSYDRARQPICGHHAADYIIIAGKRIVIRKGR